MQLFHGPLQHAAERESMASAGGFAHGHAGVRDRPGAGETRALPQRAASTRRGLPGTILRARRRSSSTSGGPLRREVDAVEHDR